MPKALKAKKLPAKRNKANKRQAVRGQQRNKKHSNEVVAKLIRSLKFVWQPKVIATGLFLMLGSVVYTNFSVQELWPIKSVKIEGEFNFLNKEHLRQKTLPVVNGGFVSVNLQVVRDTLNKLPWVEDVSVRRQWPDQLLVRVIEKQPVVYWGDTAVLSTKGKLFVPESKLSINMPRLSGPDGQHKMLLKELSRMQAWLAETGLRIEKMKLDARRSWTLEMTTGLELRLGRKQMHERLHRFVSVYKSNLETEKREIKHIDMRYTNGFAVAWKEA